MADRSPYEPLKTVAYDPAAQPVNTFVQPQKPQDLEPNLQSLSQGLAKFDAGLSGFLEERQARQNKEDEEKGQLDAIKGVHQGYTDGVQGGSISAPMSPAYQRGYDAQSGAVAGTDLHVKWSQAYEAAGGGQMDEQTFRDFNSDFMQDNIPSGGSMDYNRGLLPQLNQIATNGVTRWHTDRDKVMRGQTNAQTGAQMNQSIDGSVQAGAASPGGLNVDDTYNKLMAAREQALHPDPNNPQAPPIAPGFGEGQYDRLFVDQIAHNALEKGKLGGANGVYARQLLTVLDRKVPGQDYTYAETAYGREKQREVLNHLQTYEHQAVKDARALEKEETEKRKNDILSRMDLAAATAPDHSVPEALLAEASKPEYGLPDVRQRAAKMQDEFSKNARDQNPADELDVQRQILNGGGLQAINTAADQGRIKDPATYKRLYDLNKQYNDNRDVVDKITQDEAYKSYEKIIESRAGDSKLTNPLTGGRGDSPNSLKLKGDMSQAVLDWAAHNPGATMQMRKKAINDIGMEFVKGLPEADDIGGQPHVDMGKVQSLSGGPASPLEVGAGKGTPGQMGGSALPGAPGSQPYPTRPAPAPAPQAPVSAPAAPQPGPAAPTQGGLPDIDDLGPGQPSAEEQMARRAAQQPQGAPPAATAPAQAPTPAAPAQSQPAAPGEPPAAGSPKAPGGNADKQAFWQHFTPQQQATIKQQAEQRGQPLDQAVDAYYTHSIATGNWKPKLDASAVPIPEGNVPRQAAAPVPPQAPTPAAPQGAVDQRVDQPSVSEYVPMEHGPTPGGKSYVSVPEGFDPSKPATIVIAAGGFRRGGETFEQNVQRQKLAGGGNSILVSPDLGDKSNPGALANPGQFSKYVQEIKDKYGLPPETKIVVTGYSGGGRVVSSILKNGGDETRNIKGIQLNDATYGNWHGPIGDFVKANPGVTLESNQRQGSATDAGQRALRRAVGDNPNATFTNYTGPHESMVEDSNNIGRLVTPAQAPSSAAEGMNAIIREAQPVDDATLARVRSDFASVLGQSKGSSTPAPGQGSYTTATLRDDPTAARILDFVGKAELDPRGTDGTAGNYNAYYGHAGSQMDLSKMTFQDMESWMRTRGTTSSATGRYQFMHDTVFGRHGHPGLMQRMGFRPGDTFTPERQDAMALQLLKDRGYDRWRNGQMSDDEFANALAGEWASLPKHGGMSAYEGDGVNHALVGRQAVMDTLAGKPSGPYSPSTPSAPTGPTQVAGNAPPMPQMPVSAPDAISKAAPAKSGAAPQPPGMATAYAPAAPKSMADATGGPAPSGSTEGYQAQVTHDLSDQSLYKRRNEQVEPEALVIHHTGFRGTPEEIQKRLSEQGYGTQFIMDRDGSIYRALPEGGRGAHIRTSQVTGLNLSNGNTFGVEVIADNDKDVTPAQVAAGRQFYANIKSAYPSIKGAYGHGYLNPGHKQNTEGKTISDAIRKDEGGEPDDVRPDSDERLRKDREAAYAAIGVPVSKRGFMGGAYTGRD